MRSSRIPSRWATGAAAAPVRELPDLRSSTDERTTLVELLDFYRTVLQRKCWGLNGEQLATAIAPSEMTLGGLLLHMALVEDYWFDHSFTDRNEQDF